MVHTQSECEAFSRCLSTLPRIDTKTSVESFIKQQRLNAKAYCAEGQNYARSWNKETVNASSGGDNGPHDSVMGISTPVLKPRNPLATRRRDMEVIGRRLDKQNDNAESREKPSGRADKVPKSREDTDGKVPNDLEIREREKRLEDRRERRRTKREIVNPKKRTCPSEDSKSSSRKSPKKSVGKNKRSKVPAGLALMHGFSATNVGKSRLTIEQRLRPAGVFSKGKASAKTSVNKRKTIVTGFSELKFLNQSRLESKSREVEMEEVLSADSRSSESSRTRKNQRKSVKSARKVAIDTPSRGGAGGRKRLGARKGRNKAPTKSSSSYTLSDDPGSAQQAKQIQARAASIVWDIEKSSALLPSVDEHISGKVDDSGRGEIPHSGTRSASFPLGTTSQVAGAIIEAVSTVGPLDSASQCIAVARRPERISPREPVVSRYFPIKARDPDTTRQDVDVDEESSPGGVYEYRPSLYRDHIRNLSEMSLDDNKMSNSSDEMDAAGAIAAAELIARDSDILPQDERSALVAYSHLVDDSGGKLGFNTATDSLEECNPQESLGTWGVGAFELNHLDDVAAGDLYYADTEEIYDAEDSYLWQGVAEPWDTWLDGGLQPPDTLVVVDEDSCSMSIIASHGYDHELNQTFMDHHEDFGDPQVTDGAELHTDLRQEPEGHLANSFEFWQENEFPHAKVVSEASSDASLSSMDQIQSDEDDAEQLCQFLRGRSLLLGYPVDDQSLGRGRKLADEIHSISKAEIDVAKNLKDHWRPQKL